MLSDIARARNLSSVRLRVVCHFGNTQKSGKKYTRESRRIRDPRVEINMSLLLANDKRAGKIHVHARDSEDT